MRTGFVTEIGIKSMSTKNKIRIGIVGVGNWGRYGHIPSIQLLPEFEILAVASRRLENATEIAKEFGVPQVFSDAKALIHHPEIDLVVVLPPAPHHAAVVREAIAAVKDVYC
jgi:predicted dehydrogenase